MHLAQVIRNYLQRITYGDDGWAARMRHFPLGTQRLCCQSQSTSHSQTSGAPPSSGATPPGRAGASSGGAHHAAPGGVRATFWIIFWISLGVIVAALLAFGTAFGIAAVRQRRRGSTPLPHPGVPEAGCVLSERPRPAADPVFLPHQERPSADRQRYAAQERRRRRPPETVDEVAYRRPDRSTPARVEFNLAVSLHERGDLAGAIAAYRRAERRGDPDAGFNLGVLLSETGDLDGAETSWRRSAHYGNARATEDLGQLVRRRRERQAAGIEPERAGADPPR